MKQVLLVLIVSILMLSVSGCTDEVTATPKVSGDFVPTDSLPENYELLGVRDLSADTIGNNYVSVDGIVEGSEGLYVYMGSTDLYIDVIETDSTMAAEEFIAEYKAGFSSLRVGDRFTDVSVNEYSAVRVLDYVKVDMEYVERYTYLWNNGNFVFVVGGATEDSDVLLTLAESIGY